MTALNVFLVARACESIMLDSIAITLLRYLPSCEPFHRLLKPFESMCSECSREEIGIEKMYTLSLLTTR